MLITNNSNDEEEKRLGTSVTSFHKLSFKKQTVAL